MSTGYTLDPDETVVRHVYHHWIEILTYNLMAAIMFLVALIMVYGYGRYRDFLPEFVPAWALLLLVSIFLCLGVLILVFGSWIFKRNYLLLTNKHLIQVEQQGLFASQVDQVSLGRIQDVSGRKPGFLATLFNYGTITIQSAGEQRQFIFHRTPDPEALADYVLQMHEEFLKEHPGSGGE